MGIDRRRRRRRTTGDSAFAFARQLTLATISGSETSTSTTRSGSAQIQTGWGSGSTGNQTGKGRGNGTGKSGELIEPAWDGHRVLATRVGDDVRIVAIDHRDWTKTFPNVSRALGKLAAEKIAIDGVVCVLDERGVPSFDKLRAAVVSGAPVGEAMIMCWDVLWEGDDDLRGRPLAERRQRLAKLLGAGTASLMLSQALDGTLARVLEAAAPLGLRGVVARSLHGDYSAAWSSHPTTAEPIDWRRSLSPPPPLSNADKVLYPRDGICKRDIIGYYKDVAPLLVAHLLDRPVVVQRWPDGIDEFDWYQHRVPPRAPDYLRAAWVDGVRRIVIENSDALLWMANQAGLTYHGFTSRLASIESPDFAMIDLDPGERTTWQDLVEIALAVRRVLELLELPSVVKTSGQRGIHILVPLAPGHTYAHAEELGRGVAKLLMRLLPDKITEAPEKKDRHGKLLIDHKQYMAKTLVVPYSLRGADGATVSTPVAWDELTPKLDPRAFTLRTVRARLDANGDLAAPLLRGGAQLTAALAQLRAQ